LVYLAVEVLGAYNIGKIHHEWAKILDRFWRDKECDLLLFLCSRGFLKSSFITCYWVIQRILENPNIRILITNEKEDNAKKFLGIIRNHFQNNKMLRHIYGDFTSKQVKWTEYEFTVNNRTKSLKEPTVMIGSIDKSPVSLHMDLIIEDDLQSRINTQTKEQIDKVMQYHKDLVSLLEPGGKRVIPACLTGDTKVLMADTSWKNIKDINPGESVWSYKDKHAVIREVEAVIPQGEDDIYKISTSCHTINATDRHPLLVKRGCEITWVKVKDLKIGDKVITVARVNHETSQRLPDGRFMRKDFFYLLGFMFGDGWVIKSKTREYGYAIAMGVYEDLNQKVVKLAERWLGGKGKLKIPEGYYRFENAKAARWLIKQGLGDGAKNKRIPSWIFTQRSCYKKAFLDGLLDADGHKTKKGNGYALQLSSKQLVEDAYWLALTCGYRPGLIRSRTQTCQPPHSPKPIVATSHTLHLTYNTRQACGLNQYTWRWHKIKKIEKNGKEKVYDLTINDTGNFIANGLVVHNTRWDFNDIYGRIINSFTEKDLINGQPATEELKKQYC
jgi:hypothetical protein